MHYGGKDRKGVFVKKLSIFVICLILLIFGTSVAVFAQAQSIRSYYVAIDGQPSGPHDALSLRQLISTGYLTRDTYVWREGMVNWAFAGRVAELAPLFASVPPPIPTTPPPPTISVAVPEPSAPSVPSAPPRTTSAPRPASSPDEQNRYGVGGGGIWDWSVNNGVRTALANNNERYDGVRNTLLGLFFFYDTKYFEVDLSFGHTFVTGVTDLPNSKTTYSVDGEFQIGTSVLGKYPFDMNIFDFPVTLFPLGGLSITTFLGNEFSIQLGFLAGLGFDYFFTDSLFLRAETMFHFRLPPDDGIVMFFENGPIPTFGMGPRVKVGVGYNF